ncbi:hypothetical protein R1sor_006259 [Riccia sorocarpa]|uniref:Translocator protein n=1 Tax=Riccia sorocarpa TaxID=122646 RepID=A0ABD3HMJ7_9MARC
MKHYGMKQPLHKLLTWRLEFDFSHDRHLEDLVASCLRPLKFTKTTRSRSVATARLVRSGTLAENLATRLHIHLPAAMNSMVAAVISSSPTSSVLCSTAVSRRFSSKTAPAAAANCVARSSVLFGGAVNFDSRLRLRQYSGLRRMSTTEGLAKRSRDPQFQQGEDALKDQTAVGAQRASDLVKKSRSYVAATMSKPGVKSLLVAVAIPLVLGTLDGLVNAPNTPWYFELKKPRWQPPGFLFGGAWSILYPLMGLASWLVWAEGGFQLQGKPLTLYITQLVLNLLWPILFFGKKNLGLALVDIVALCGTLFATVKAFQPVNHVAANLMKPYLGWVVFATILNANLWYLNRGGSGAVEHHAHAE